MNLSNQLKHFPKAAYGLLALLLLMTGCKSAEAVPTEADMAAYLMVYFKDNSHGIHFALSSDGHRFTALNNGQPVIDVKAIAEQQGVRDPHITRGPDGHFYMAMTDLHIFAQREGLRDSEWQRDGHQYGWGNNRGFVLMKSKDLIHWSHSQLRLDLAYPGLEDIGAAWAPQTIYDEEAGKMMLYFTMRFRNGHNRLYYAYTDDAFTKLVSEPKLLFQYPKDISYIDADITRVGDQFHLFYTPHDGTPGIKHAVSDHINRNYRYLDEWIDPESGACEAPNLWKRIGEERWVLMYDCYGVSPHNFSFSETNDFEHWEHIGRFNEGTMQTDNFTSPKHGAVIHLTRAEAERLARHWALKTY